jgi:MoxR-like ATPase
MKYNDKNNVETKDIKDCADMINSLKKEIAKVVTGQEEIVNSLLRGIICDGHVLLEGIPGIAKTLVIRALGAVTGCSVKRVQFTVDLLPTDIVGVTTYNPQKGFEVIKGPVFANFLIADEINRSPPKTQSALIEAMQEKNVTIGRDSFSLPSPFFVMATKNPIESSGVYSLPEAQLDRFLFNVVMSYPNILEEKEIMEKNITLNKFEDFDLKVIARPKDLITLQNVVKKVYLGDAIKDYILAIVSKTRDKKFRYSDCISYGVSPRGSIALFIASKANALINGRNYVIPEDVKEVTHECLRHRLNLSYKSTVRGINSDEILTRILNEVSID